MAYNHEYPYVDPNRYNSDWILNKIKELEGEMDTFEALNKITFDGEWNITKQYPAWCIVNTNNGTEGYISLKPVPAGVTIDNTEYWTSVVNYTATIADLQNRVVALEADVLDINDRIDHLSDKYIVFLGDSYQFVGDGWVDGVAAGLGVASGNYYNYCASGHAFYDNEWRDDLASFVSDYPDEAQKITDVIIVGGINDSSAAAFTNLESYIDNFFAYVAANLPNAHVTMGYVGNASESSSVLNGRTQEWRAACYAKEREVFSKNGGTYLAGTENILWQYGLIGSDKLHPSTAGVAKIITGIVQAIKAGKCEIISYQGLGVTNWYESFLNGQYRLHMRNVKIPTGSVISDTELDITSAITYPNYISANTTFVGSAMVEDRDTSGTKLIPVDVYMKDHKLYVVQAYAASRTAYPSDTVGSACYIHEVNLYGEAQGML